MKIVLTDEELKAERWHEIEILDRKYKISNMGRMMSYVQTVHHFMKPKVNNSGDLSVNIEYGRRRKPVTIMIGLQVAMAFVDNPNRYKYIRFKDGDKTNCRASNLEWVKFTERMQKLHEARQRRVNVYSSKGIYIKTFESGKKAAEYAGLDANTIYKCCKHHEVRRGFIFRYADESPEGQNVEDVKKPLNPVYQYDKNGNFIHMFESMKDVEIALEKKGVAGNISKCAKGERPSAYGYVWRFDKG